MATISLAGCRHVSKNRVYVIGTDNTYPYHFLNSQGEAVGMTGEVLAEAAKRCGLLLKWKVHPEGPHAALQAHRVDLWPLLSVTPDTWPNLHFTRPYLSNAFVVVTVGPPQTFQMNTGAAHRVAIVGFPVVTKLAAQTFPKAALVRRPNRKEALSAVCRGEADLMLVEARAAQHLALDRPAECEGKPLATYGLDMPSKNLAIASTKDPEAILAADYLRDEIDRMLADGSMDRILRHWNYFYGGEASVLYREAEARSANRVSMLLAIGLAILSALLFVLLVRVRRAQRAAVAADLAKSMFLANMSHEIRTPMNGIIGMNQLALALAKDDEQKDYLETVGSSATSLLALLNDILDFSRIEAGKLSLEFIPFQPRQLLKSAIQLIEVNARTKKLEIRAEVAPSVPESIAGDPLRIRQVLINLLGNAVKFTEAGHIDVCITSSDREKRVRFAVRDTGIGIPADQQKTIFAAFTQADGSISRRYGGTGLGLAISSKLIQMMGGTIRLESEPGRGTLFEFEVPYQVPSGPAQPRAVDSAADAPFTARRILLAEDNPVNQKVATRLLENNGHSVFVVSNGKEAVAAIGRESFDLVLMDIQMPEMDGFEATARVRASETDGSHLPIIAMTAHTMSGDREKCLAAGMDGYLSKPVQLAQLLQAIAEAGRPPVNSCSPE